MLRQGNEAHQKFIDFVERTANRTPAANHEDPDLQKYGNYVLLGEVGLMPCEELQVRQYSSPETIYSRYISLLLAGNTILTIIGDEERITDVTNDYFWYHTQQDKIDAMAIYVIDRLNGMADNGQLQPARENIGLLPR